MITIRLCVFASFLVNMVDAGGVSFYDAIPSFKLESSTPTGTWGPWELCPYEVAVEDYSLYYKADQGASGIRLKCAGSPLAATSTIEEGSQRTQDSGNICASGLNGAKVTLNDVVNKGIVEVQMYCSDDATNALLIPQTDGYTGIFSTTSSSDKFCSTGHRICGVRTQISSTNGLEAVEFACCSILPDTTGDISNDCDFENGYCGWSSEGITLNAATVEEFPVFDIGNEMRYPAFASIPGPTSGDGTGKFVYYFSYAPKPYTNLTGDFSSKAFNSPTYGGLATRDPKFSFKFYADNSLLAQLSMCVIATNGDVIQKQILFNRFVDDLEYFNSFRTSAPEWRPLTFPLYANNTEFTIRFVVEKLDKIGSVGAGSSNFGFDTFSYVSKSSGSCASPGCHDNATCTNDASLLVGFSCECKPGFNGTGANVTDGCVEIMPCNDASLCMQSEGNVCTHLGPGNYSCSCDSPYWELNNASDNCIDIDECANITFCDSDNRTTCTNMVGNYSCECLTGHTQKDPSLRFDFECATDGGWTAWSDVGDTCSVDCGGGTYNATRNCTNPVPELGGLDCVGDSYNETASCNEALCSAVCPVFKNCSACGNFTDFEQNGPLNLTLLYFDGLSSGDLTWAMTQLSKWNQSVVEEICITSYCDVSKLNDSITAIGVDVTKVNNLSGYTNDAKLKMRDILDCNGDLVNGHNEWLWEIFDKLCEYDAFLPNIYEDMHIKKGMLEAERDRCMGRTHLRALMEVMYRKW